MTAKDEAVQELVRGDFEVEPDLQKVVRFRAENEDDPREPIKLLTVTSSTVSTLNVESYVFPPTKSVPFPTAIAEVTPEEFERIRHHELKLPDGWSLERIETYDRPPRA
jgi:hypothetical protein